MSFQISLGISGLPETWNTGGQELWSHFAVVYEFHQNVYQNRADKIITEFSLLGEFDL